MSNHKNRLAKLETRSQEAAQFPRPRIVEIYGTREDGTRYLIETWPQLVRCQSPLTDQEGQAVDLANYRSHE